MQAAKAWLMQQRSHLQQCFHFCILLCSERCQVHAQTVDKGLKGAVGQVSVSGPNVCEVDRAV